VSRIHHPSLVRERCRSSFAFWVSSFLDRCPLFGMVFLPPSCPGVVPLGLFRLNHGKPSHSCSAVPRPMMLLSLSPYSDLQDIRDMPQGPELVDYFPQKFLFFFFTVILLLCCWFFSSVIVFLLLFLGGGGPFLSSTKLFSS